VIRSSALRPFAPIFLALALLGTFPGGANAFNLGARAGYGSAEGDDEGSPSLGAYARFDLPGPVNLELAGDAWTSERSQGRIEARTLPLQASALLYPFPSVLIKPYLLGGAGITMVRLKSLEGTSAERDDHLFSFQAGAGFDVPLPLLVLTADLRYFFTEELTADVGGIPEKPYRPGGWRLTAGAALKF